MLIFVPLIIKCLFSLSSFEIFPLTLVFRNLIDIVLFMFLVLVQGVCGTSWIDLSKLRNLSFLQCLQLGTRNKTDTYFLGSL